MCSIVVIWSSSSIIFFFFFIFDLGISYNLGCRNIPLELFGVGFSLGPWDSGLLTWDQFWGHYIDWNSSPGLVLDTGNPFQTYTLWVWPGLHFLYFVMKSLFKSRTPRGNSLCYPFSGLASPLFLFHRGSISLGSPAFAGSSPVMPLSLNPTPLPPAQVLPLDPEEPAGVPWPQLPSPTCSPPYTLYWFLPPRGFSGSAGHEQKFFYAYNLPSFPCGFFRLGELHKLTPHTAAGLKVKRL